MTSQLPPALLELFAPRPPLRYVAPAKAPPGVGERITGVAAYTGLFERSNTHVVTETAAAAVDRRKSERLAAHAQRLKEGRAKYNPEDDRNVRGDPYKTLFVSRLPFETTTEALQGLFAKYGVVARARVVEDKKGKSRGYGFVVFERERDARDAARAMDGAKVGDRTIVVDVERGRTVRDWLPRRLGGGLGGRNYTKIEADNRRPFNVHASNFGGGPRGKPFGSGGDFAGRRERERERERDFGSSDNRPLNDRFARASDARGLPQPSSMSSGPRYEREAPRDYRPPPFTSSRDAAGGARHRDDRVAGAAGSGSGRLEARRLTPPPIASTSATTRGYSRDRAGHRDRDRDDRSTRGGERNGGASDKDRQRQRDHDRSRSRSRPRASGVRDDQRRPPIPSGAGAGGRERSPGRYERRSARDPRDSGHRSHDRGHDRDRERGRDRDRDREQRDRDSGGYNSGRRPSRDHAPLLDPRAASASLSRAAQAQALDPRAYTSSSSRPAAPWLNNAASGPPPPATTQSHAGEAGGRGRAVEEALDPREAKRRRY